MRKLSRLVLIIPFLFADPAVAYRQPDLLTRIDDKIKSEKVFVKAIDYRLNLFKDELSVSTFQHPLANFKDMKIEALLTAHSVLEVTRDKISKINVFYFDKNDNSRFFQAIIDTNLLKELQKKSFDKDQALARVSLEKSTLPNPIKKNYLSMSYKEITAGLPLSEGVMKAQRQALALRIENLKENGVDVTSLTSLFLKLDDSIRHADTRIKPLYLYTLSMTEELERRNLSFAKNPNK